MNSVYNFNMQIQELKNKTILMLGKSRALSSDEYLKQLQTQDITLTHTLDENVIAVIEGKMLNPLEENRLEKIYFEKKLPIIGIDVLEKWLCSHINDKKLLMSLKLSRDSDRLFGFLTNPMIGDELFLKLFGMYNFKNESFFENDDNRDVTAALIGRFYSNVKRDHNVVYSSMGMVRLIEKTDNALLVETIGNLHMIKEALKEEFVEGSHFTILQALCIHDLLSLEMQKRFASSLHVELKLLLSTRENLDKTVEKLLLDSDEESVKEQLSYNPTISNEAIEILAPNYISNIISNHHLDETLFERFLVEDIDALCSNIYLNEAMQLRLIEMNVSTQILALNPSLTCKAIALLESQKSLVITEALAQNSALALEKLEFMMSDDSLHVALSKNSAISEKMAEKLSLSTEFEVLENLAQNSATSFEVLNLLMLDYRLEHLVRANPVIHKNFRR